MVKEFIAYQRTNKGLTAETLSGYEKELQHFIGYAKRLGLRWSTITDKDIDAYVEAEAARGMSARTIKKRVEVLRLIYTWAIHRGLLNKNPARYTQTPKVRQELPKAADAQKLREYLAQEPTSRESMLTHIIVALILETGLRIGEVTALTGEDIDTEKQAIRITGKGGKERIVYYGGQTADYARMMAHKRGRIFTEDATTLRYMMYRELPGVHPHAIRHAFAIDQLNKGMDLKTLGTLLGHKHVETTEIYAKMTNERTSAIYKQLNA